ncbi:MAG: hypothetical protein Q9227_008831 [Pyrenula ochraceoflavens]
MEDIRAIHAYWADRSGTPPVDPTTSFKGKTVIITGANVGLGFEAAAKFFTLGASKLILACRGIAKGEQAKSRILARQNPPANAEEKQRIEVWQLDMLSYPSILAFADRASKSLPRIDAVLLNAGVAAKNHQKTAYGWERTLQVNVLSTALLAILLLPKLRQQQQQQQPQPVTEDGPPQPPTSPPVLEIVGSGAQYLAKLKPRHRTSPNLLDSVNEPKEGWGVRQYNLSKLFVQHMVRTLADRESALAPAKPSEPSVRILAVCPGSVRSELGRDYNGCFDEFGKAVIAKLMMRSTEEGARTLVSGVVEGMEGSGQGGLWQHDRWREEAGVLRGEGGRELQGRVWREIVEALGKDVPEVRGLVGME